MLVDEDIDALLSPKGPSSDELLSASPTLEGKLEVSDLYSDLPNSLTVARC